MQISIAAAVAVKSVIAGEAIKRVGAVGSVERIGPGGAEERSVCCDVVMVPDRAVIERDVLDAVVRGQELVADRDRFAGVAPLNGHVVTAGMRQGHVGG